MWIYLKFFRRLYNPDEPDWRRRTTTPCASGIGHPERKEKSRYKPSNQWTDEEVAVFLQYCPSVRDRTFLARAIDTSTRPSELLRLRIRDVCSRCKKTE